MPLDWNRIYGGDIFRSVFEVQGIKTMFLFRFVKKVRNNVTTSDTQVELQLALNPYLSEEYVLCYLCLKKLKQN